MTAPTPSESAPSKRSPAVVAAIVIVIVIVLAGGAYVVYKLTDKKDAGVPAYKVAKTVLIATQQGNTAVITKNSTPDGAQQLRVLKANSVGGMTLVKCAPGLEPKTRVCQYSRPGGLLTLQLQNTAKVWKVSGASLGPAGLPPSTTTTT